MRVQRQYVTEHDDSYQDSGYGSGGLEQED